MGSNSPRIRLGHIIKFRLPARAQEQDPACIVHTLEEQSISINKMHTFGTGLCSLNGLSGCTKSRGWWVFEGKYVRRS